MSIVVNSVSISIVTVYKTLDDVNNIWYNKLHCKMIIMHINKISAFNRRNI